MKRLLMLALLGACAGRATVIDPGPCGMAIDAPERAHAVDLYLATDSGPRPPADTEGLARKTQNPVSDLISLPLQNNTYFGVGPGDDTTNDLNIQPVVPFDLNEDWRLITRTILPVKYVPEGLSGNDNEWGLGDTNVTLFLSPKEESKVIWGVGPVVILPTSTARHFGLGEWGAGAGAVALTMPGKWVVGALASNYWTFDGGANIFFSQYFVNYNLDDGWYLSSAPIITANWDAPSDDQWTVPFGGGGGKIFKIGNQPMNAQVQVFYNAVRPDNGPEWSMRIQLQFLFPK